MFGIKLGLKRVFLLPMVLACMCVVVSRVEEEDSPRQQQLAIIFRREQSAVLWVGRGGC